MPFVQPAPTGQAPSVTDRQLRAVIETIPGLVWLAGVDGGAEYLNRRWLEYTGLSQADAAGWGWTVAIHPDDLDRLTNYWRSVLQSGTPGQTEARLRRFDGAYRWFMFTAEPVRDESGGVTGWCGTNLDIDDRRRAEDAVRESQHDLSLIVNSIPGIPLRLPHSASLLAELRKYLRQSGIETTSITSSTTRASPNEASSKTPQNRSSINW